MHLTTSIFLERGNPELQDRVEILPLNDRTVVIVADGAGGRSGGAEAAELFLHSVRAVAASLTSSQDCCHLLCQLDQKITRASDCGETTGIVAVVHPGQICGANVGDSAAWLFLADAKEELSRVRKPFIGTGMAVPHQFTTKAASGTLVVATDGLWKYTSLELITRKIRDAIPENLASELAELVRLRSGAFPDDIAVATCRLTP